MSTFSGTKKNKRRRCLPDTDVVVYAADEDTGDVLEDRRSPDWNGDRQTLAYQGIDPDTRGPFPNAQGGFRPGGSMLS